MFWFCRHNYELVKEETTKSIQEKLKDNGFNLSTKGAYVSEFCELTRYKKYFIFKCKKCSKIKVETIIC